MSSEVLHDWWAHYLHGPGIRFCLLVERTATVSDQYRWLQAYTMARASLGDETLQALVLREAPVILCDLREEGVPRELWERWQTRHWAFVSGETLSTLFAFPRVNLQVSVEARALTYSFVLRESRLITEPLLYGAG